MRLRSTCFYIGFWVFISCFFATRSLHAQVPANPQGYVISLKHITLEQGLPNRTVTTVGQDREGFIWIGSLEGAYRFDGVRFGQLAIPANIRQQQASNPAIEMIRTDRAGNLWMASNVVMGSRMQYILKPGQSVPQTFENVFGRANPFRNDPIYDYIPSLTGSFRYVRSRRGVIWWNRGHGQFRPLFTHPGLAGTNAFRFTALETAGQTLLLTYPSSGKDGSNELVELDSVGRVLRRQGMSFTAKPLWKDSAGAVYFQRLPEQNSATLPVPNPLDKLLYRLTPDGTLTALPIRLSQNPFADPTRYPFSELKIFFDHQHNLFWICGPQVLVAWHPQHGVVYDLASTGFPMTSIQKAHQILIDQTGGVWVSTLNGVLLLKLEPNRFQRYLHLANPRKDATRQAIRGMLTLGSNLWVNAQESQLVDKQTGRSQFVFNNALGQKKYLLNQCPVVLGPDGMIWSGADGLLCIDPKTYQTTPVSVLPDNPLVTIWPQGNTLWLGYNSGIAQVDLLTRRVKPFGRYNGFNELSKSRINGFFPDKRTGTIWVAASTGLYRIDSLRGIMARYRTHSSGGPLPVDHITFVHPDPDSAEVYWLATRGGGLLRWDRRRGVHQQFTRRQGLSDNTLYAIYEDRYGRLWLPSNYGLMSFDRHTHRVQVFHAQDGIADEEFNLIAHHRAPDGRLYLGGMNGITAFYPDQIRIDKPLVQPLQVTQYQKLNTQSGQMVNHLPEYQQRGGILLSPSDRLFSLSFTLLDYRNLDHTRYWYRIQGWQEKWIMLPSSELRINGLPAGYYTLQVRAQTPSGSWASPVLSVPVSVEQIFYARPLFILLCLLLSGVAIWLVFRWRNRQLIKDKNRLEAEVARRTKQVEADKAIIAKQAADLQANAALKARFFANVTHEFRTPLTLLSGPLHYLSSRVADGKTKQLLGTMERNAQQLLTLVNDLLDLSRLGDHQLALTEQPADLAQVVRETVNTFAPQAAYAGISLHIEGGGQALPMLLDAQKMETVLRNLLSNALKHTPKGGQITVCWQQTDSEVRLQVSDTGSGIHPDDLPHLFERYFQTNQTDKPLHGGTGIGLALCGEYCRLWGGQITVDSQLGRGSTFTITYPIRSWQPAGTVAPGPDAFSNRDEVKSETQPLSDPQAEQQPVSKPTADKRLLVVDDNRDMLLYIETILSPYYTLQTAPNGREALDMLGNLPADQLPDLIISDIMMPEVDGLELTGALRSNPALRGIPVVLLTARADLESRLQALEMGVADYLTKPFYEAELLTRVQNLLRRQEEQSIWMGQENSEPQPGEPERPSDSIDKAWLREVQLVIRQNLADEFFSVKTLAELLSSSDRQLLRRCKTLTGMSPSQLIQEVRLQVARELIETHPDRPIKAIAYQVGYQKTSYFIQLYRERFGSNPGAMIRQLGEAQEADT
ncbi:ATP-binding protein [Rudanella lutea]|uniref:ATP-binding protein n=1 Tax=Rudanella lutea TaxID=451374 RepID=UPI0003A9D66A|nr:ATP-binding protein [Rudanella lutea]